MCLRCHYIDNNYFMDNAKKDNNNSNFELDTSKLFCATNQINKLQNIEKCECLFKNFEKDKLKFKNHFFFQNLNDDGFCTHQNLNREYFDFYKNVIDSDVGIVVTGGFYAKPRNIKTNHLTLNLNNKNKLLLKELTDYAHINGTKIFACVKSLFGRLDQKNKILNCFSGSMSFNTDFFDTRLLTARLSDSTLNSIAECFGDYANIITKCNFDGLVIDASLNNLIGESLSKKFNSRVFGYYSERLDFIAKIIKYIKQKSPKLNIYLKINVDDCFNEIFGKTQKYIKSIKNYNNFNQKSNKFAIFGELISFGINGFIPVFGTQETKFLSEFNMFTGENLWLEFYKSLNEYIESLELKQKPVIVYTDCFYNLSKVSKTVKNKLADFVCITKEIYADNNYIKKIKTQKDVNLCVKCSHCDKMAQKIDSIECLINPDTLSKNLTKAKTLNGKTVAVVGSGTAGLVASVVLAERGYDVVVFEKSKVINSRGNAETIFGFDYMRENFNKYLNSKISELLKQNKIQVKLGTEFLPSTDSKNYYAIILATGFHEKLLSVQGAVLKNVKSIYDALSEKSWLALNKHIVIYAKSELSFKLALYLLNNKKKVTIVIENLSSMIHNIPSSSFNYYFYEFDRFGANVLIDSRIKKIEEDFIEVAVWSKFINKDFLPLALNYKNSNINRGEQRVKSVDCDLLIYEPELYSNNKLFYELVSNMFEGELYMVGSAFQISSLAEDIKSAYFVAKNL